MYAWMTARRIRPGTMEQFKNAWEVHREHVPGLINVYYMQDARDPNRMIGLAIWTNEDAFDRYAATIDEARRKEAMNPYVEDVEWQRFFQVAEY